MGMNIKNKRTHDLAKEVASLTGESVTEAVTVALEQRLNRLRHERQMALSERLLAIGRDVAARLKEPYRSADHADLLYDEKGLPK